MEGTVARDDNDDDAIMMGGIVQQRAMTMTMMPS